MILVPLDLFDKIKEIYEELMVDLSADIDHKTLFSIVSKKYSKYQSYLMFYHKKKFSKIWWSIHQEVRPTSNVLPDSVTCYARLKRIIEEI